MDVNLFCKIIQKDKQKIQPLINLSFSLNQCLKKLGDSAILIISFDLIHIFCSQMVFFFVFLLYANLYCCGWWKALIFVCWNIRQSHIVIRSKPRFNPVTKHGLLSWGLYHKLMKILFQLVFHIFFQFNKIFQYINFLWHLNCS